MSFNLEKTLGLPYRSPHKLRHGHGVFGVKAVEDIEQFKAFSQNMMHESMEITDRLYGKLAGDDVKDTISNLVKNKTSKTDEEKLFEQFLTFKKRVENQN